MLTAGHLDHHWGRGEAPPTSGSTKGLIKIEKISVHLQQLYFAAVSGSAEVPVIASVPIPSKDDWEKFSAARGKRQGGDSFVYCIVSASYLAI